MIAGGASGWDDARPAALRAESPAEPDAAFHVDLDTFEGPLDLLLALARAEKVDLSRISMARLAEQYIAFIARAGTLRLEIAADYLVMAAWLAYLKSRLLLPAAPGDAEPSGEELAAALAERLRRLDAIRGAAARLLARQLVGRDLFLRGAPEPRAAAAISWEASLIDLLKAYAEHEQRRARRVVRVAVRQVWALAEARDILVRLVGEAADWVPLDRLLAPWMGGPERATARASTFSASLELAREGRVELRQSAAFAPIEIRGRAAEEAKA